MTEIQPRMLWELMDPLGSAGHILGTSVLALFLIYWLICHLPKFAYKAAFTDWKT
jgi:hypothetical protein